MYTLYLLLVTSFIIYGSQSHAFETVSLKEAIQLGLENNPRTQANSIRLQSEFEKLKAARQSAYLPHLQVGYSRDLNTPNSQHSFVQLNLNLFNGFSDYYNLKTKECYYKLSEANYNSTNAFLQNTSGQIVGLVVSSYIELVRVRQTINYYQQLLDRLKKSSQFAKTAKQKSSFENYINSTSISTEALNSELKIAESNYKTAVNLPAPNLIDSFSDTAKSIQIPASADESFEISLNKSPEILKSKLELECQQLSYQTQKSRLYSARVDLSFYQSHSFNNSKSNTNSAEVRLSIPFDIGRMNSLKADAQNLVATELDLEGTISDVKNDLLNTYIDLESIEKSTSSYEKLVDRNEVKIQQYLTRLESLDVDQIDDLYSLLGATQGYNSMLNSYYIQTINLKYNIQRNIGTLFETNNLISESGRTSFIAVGTQQ